MGNIIGEQLVREGLISAAQLVEALALQKREGGHLEEVLTSLGFAAPGQLHRFFQSVPKVPLKVADTGLSEPFLTDLLLKTAYLEAGTFSLQQVSGALSLPFSVVDELAQLLIADELVSIRGATGYTRAAQVFELTKRGRARAEGALETSSYVGAAPVPLQDYTRALVRQSVRQIKVDDEWVYS